MSGSVCILKNGYYSNPRVFRDAYALFDEGYSVDVICLRDKEEKLFEKMRGVRIYRIPLKHRRGGIIGYFIEYGIFFTACSLLLSCLYFKRKYKIIQAINMPDFLVFAAIIPKIGGAKIILAMPEPAPELLTASRNNASLMRNILRVFQRASCWFADMVLPVTIAMQRYLCEKGMPESKQVVILNVPDEEIFKTIESSPPHSDKNFRLVYAGSLVKRFGIETMIRSVLEVDNRIPSLILDIYGSGEFEPEARALVKSLNLEQKVKMHGFIAPDKIPLHMSQADVCLVTILKNDYSELVHTHKMFEAAASKKPAIVSRIGSVLEYFGEDSFCFFKSGNAKDLARCTIELYENPEKRRKLAENAYFRYQKLRWKETKKIYLRAVEDLIDKR